jgi:hypothetical protein
MQGLWIESSRSLAEKTAILTLPATATTSPKETVYKMERIK